MNTVELKALNDLLGAECGWRVETGGNAGGEEFFRVFMIRPNDDSDDTDGFVGVMPICTTFGAFVSAGALCQYYYQKGRVVSEA